jgi:uncharacterized protein (DUF305 family)
MVAGVSRGTTLRRSIVPLLAGAAAGAALALLLWPSGLPDTDSVEAGFARDMATHHAQAVEMSFLIRDKSSDDILSTLAYDIILTQGAQRGVFMGWLQAWGVPQSSSGARMAWMPRHAGMPGHASAPSSTNGGDPLMHGMATEEELQRLREAQGTEAEVLFLQLMIRHHEGGVIMARAVEGLSSRPEVLGIARSVDEAQRAEIAAMTEMLMKRSARPFDSLLE